MYRLLLQAPPVGNSSDDDYLYLDEMEGDENLFPADLFTSDQLRQGAVLLYILGILFVFMVLITVTKEFLMPALEVMREKLGVSHDVAGAVIIPTMLAIPSLVTNTIGVFMAVPQVKVGSMVGSSVFNVLGLLGICGLLRKAETVVTINCWPILRNFIFYFFTLIILIVFFSDSVIQLWESAILLVLFLVYCVLMMVNTRLQSAMDSCCCCKSPDQEAAAEADDKPLDMSFPRESASAMLVYIIMFPVRAPLWLTLPDTRKETSRKLFPLALVGSLVWITVSVYCLVWWTSVTGATMGVPAPVLGLTILALGTSLPHLVTGVLLTRRGHPAAVLSLAMGANIVGMTLLMPLPWLLFSLVYGYNVTVNTAGLGCSVSLLIIMIILAFLFLVIFRRRLTRGLGVTLTILYLLFVAVALSLTFQIIVCPI